MDTIKIIISGIGGVGGYIGGMLAAYYEADEKVEVYFLARGENEAEIKTNGLLLETTEGKKVAHPTKVSSDPTDFPVADYIFCCTKSYDLAENIQQLMPCIGRQTVVVSLLNGVDHRREIQAILPDNEIWDGCIYIISRLAQPGLVKVNGRIASIYFGAEDGDEKKMSLLGNLCRNAGIDTHEDKNIISRIWEKFFFISTTATLTSFLNVSLGEIHSNKEYHKQIQQLLLELKKVADAKEIELPEDIIEKNLTLLSKVPPESTTSMHSDFQRKKDKTELVALTEYVVAQADKLGVDTPVYKKTYAALSKR